MEDTTSMAENEQQHPSESTQDGSGDGSAKKRRRRRGKRRPSGDSSQATSDTDAPAAASEGSANSSGDNAESGSEKRGRSRRRKKKRPEGEGGEGESKESKEQSSEQSAKESADKDSKKGRGRRDGGKKEKEKKERAPRGSVLDRRRTRGDAPLDFPDDEPMMPTAPPPTATSVDGYIKQLRGWQREVVMTLRSIIKSQAADAEEDILWHQPVYSLNGPICYVKAFSDHVNLGFWRGNEIDDPAERLIGELQTMRHVTIRHVNEVDRDLFEAYVRQAVKLNKEKGDPTGV